MAAGRWPPLSRCLTALDSGAPSRAVASLSVVDWAAVLASSVSLVASLRVLILLRLLPVSERSKSRNVLLWHTFVTDLCSAVTDMANLASPVLGCHVAAYGTNFFYLASATISAIQMVYAWALVSGRARRASRAVRQGTGCASRVARLEAAIGCGYGCCLAFTVAPTLASREIVGSDGHWCWLKAWALETHWPYTTFYGPLWVCIVVIVVFYAKMRDALARHAASIDFLHADSCATPRQGARLNRAVGRRRQSRFSLSLAPPAAAASPPRNAAEAGRNRLVDTLSTFARAMVAIWLIPTARRMAQVIAPGYVSPLWLVLAHTVSYRLQGQVNAAIFIHSLSKKVSDADPRENDDDASPAHGGTRRPSVVQRVLRRLNSGIELLERAVVVAPKPTTSDADADDADAAARTPSFGMSFGGIFTRRASSTFEITKPAAVARVDADVEAPPPPPPPRPLEAGAVETATDASLSDADVPRCPHDDDAPEARDADEGDTEEGDEGHSDEGDADADDRRDGSETPDPCSESPDRSAPSETPAGDDGGPPLETPDQSAPSETPAADEDAASEEPRSPRIVRPYRTSNPIIVSNPIVEL